MRTRVKICGITRLLDAKIAVDAGVDALGLVFYKKSSRYISCMQAQKICQAIPAFVSRTALFKDADKASINKVLSRVEIDLIQFHGNETPQFCQQFNLPYIKALGMVQNSEQAIIASIKKSETAYNKAKALLYDAHAPGEAGGTGNTFNWQILAKIKRQKSTILAGGLNPENIVLAINTLQPYAVDVSGGVEQSPGIKDKHKIISFMKKLQQQH